MRTLKNLKKIGKAGKNLEKQVATLLGKTKAKNKFPYGLIKNLYVIKK